MLPNPDVSTPSPSPDIDSTPSEDVNPPSESTPFKVYNKFSDLINPNLNFINKNFKAEPLANGMYRKNYRLHQLLKNALWKFDKVSNSFSWTIDEQWITNMISRDGDNVNLYLYIENLTPVNAEEIDFPSRALFRDYLEKKQSQIIFLNLKIFKDTAMLKDTTLWVFKLIEQNLKIQKLLIF